MRGREHELAGVRRDIGGAVSSCFTPVPSSAARASASFMRGRSRSNGGSGPGIAGIAPPRPWTALPAAFRYSLAVLQRIPVSRWIRRNVQPSRPSGLWTPLDCERAEGRAN